nr:hypothetical protein [Candidatus Woesearchaeota archaeon]
ATVSSTIQLTAAASDNVAVANVQFKLDGSNLGTLDTTSPYSITWDTTLTSNGQHVLTAVATDTSGNTATSTSVTVTVNNVVQPANAFTGQYFNNMDFTSLALTRTDNQINFDWSTNSPDPNIGVDTFSVRWQGDFSFTGKVYTFTARTDDGMRIWIDNQLVLDKWIDQAPTTYTFTNTMTSGAHNIKVEYYENGGLAVAQVSWA